MVAYAISMGMGGVMIYGNTTDLHDGSYKVASCPSIWAPMTSDFKLLSTFHIVYPFSFLINTRRSVNLFHNPGQIVVASDVNFLPACTHFLKRFIYPFSSNMITRSWHKWINLDSRCPTHPLWQERTNSA